MHSRQILLYDSYSDILAILSLLIQSLCYFDAFYLGIFVNPLGEVYVPATAGSNDHFVLLDCECLKLGADYILAFFVDLDDGNINAE